MSGTNPGGESAHRREDEELYAALRRTGFQGPTYDEFVVAVTDYASGWLWKKIRSGEIFGYLRTIGRPRAQPIQWCQHDIEDLVNDSVTDGFLDFHNEALVNGRWDSSKASLRTLLVRYCATRFADHYEQWLRRSSFRLLREANRDPSYRSPWQAPSAERIALARQELNQVGPEQFGKAVGYTHKELGELFGITERAVEYRLRRDRREKPDAGTGEGGMR